MSAPEQVHLEHYLDGGWRASTGSDRLIVSNPARRSETVGSIPAGTSADVDAAVAAATAAHGEWARTSVRERADLLRKAGDALIGIDPSAPAVLTREMGKVIAESMMDFGTPPMVWSTHLDDVDRLEQLLDATANDDLGAIRLRRRPVGVVGAIVPWNWPIALLGVKLGPALLAGNTVVAVPSPNASLSVLRAVEALGAVLPPGTVNVVAGAGETVGAALAAHTDVGMVAFTGGDVAGRAVATALGSNLRRGVFELGGNDAAVLLDDVVVDDALVQQLVAGAFLTSGQVCFAIKRIYAHRSIADAVVAAMADVLAGTVVGDGLDPAVTMGPVANDRQQARLQALVADATAAGATVTEVGHAQDGVDWDGGSFELPKLVTGIDQAAALVQQEQFGPALPIVAFDDDGEAVRLANGTAFGLTGSVWSADRDRARGLAAQIDAGVTFVNQHGMAGFDPRYPFGGTKGSGYGREMGDEGLLEFTWSQVVNDRHVSF